MARLDDTSIMQFVDGELSAEEAGEVERLMASDPGARARADIFRSTRDLLRSALDETPAPAPQRLVDAATAPAPSVPPPDAVLLPRRPAARWLRPLAAAIAVFVVGGALGYEMRAWLPEPLGGGGVQARALSEIAKSYKVFAVDGPRTVELGPDQRPLIERWFARRLSHAISMPDLSRHGLTFGGGRLMALEEGPVALAVYYTAEKKPVGLCITPWQGGQVRPTADRRGESQMVFWTSSGYLHVLIGQTEPSLLMRLVEDAGHALSAPAPAGNRS